MKKFKDSDFYIVLAVILIIVILIISAGKYDLTKKQKELPHKPKKRIFNEEEIREIIKKQKIAKLREEKENIISELNKLNSLKNTLEKRFKRLYFVVRTSLIIIWLIPFVIYSSFKNLHGFTDITNCIESLLNYTQFIVLIVLISYFIISGSISTIPNIGKGIANTVRRFVYRRYVNVDVDILDKNVELENIENEISLLEKSK